MLEQMIIAYMTVFTDLILWIKNNLDARNVRKTEIPYKDILEEQKEEPQKDIKSEDSINTCDILYIGLVIIDWTSQEAYFLSANINLGSSIIAHINSYRNYKG